MSASVWACDLKVESAWIREAPPNATALAGYLTLTNTGAKPLSIAAIESAAFTRVEMHETVTTNGLASMQAINKLTLAGGERVTFAPGGKHLMLMGPKQALKKGDVVTFKLKDDAGCVTNATFKVSAATEQSDSQDSMPMDHSKMHHNM